MHRCHSLNYTLHTVQSTVCTVHLDLVCVWCEGAVVEVGLELGVQMDPAPTKQSDHILKTSKTKQINLDVVSVYCLTRSRGVSSIVSVYSLT